MTVKVIEVVEGENEVIEVVVAGPQGPQGPQGLSIPTEIVTELPTVGVEGTLYIKV